MKVVEVQFADWDKHYTFSLNSIDAHVGDYIIVETTLGIEMGTIKTIKELDDQAFAELSKMGEIKPVVRKANLEDLKKREHINNQKDQAMDMCKSLIQRHDLPMKLVDVHFSFSGDRITFAFSANGRVDFRMLVKDLTRHYRKLIRLHQIGIRDEAKINGDVGICGMVQCCRTHLRELGNVSPEHAEIQQVSHRGAERLSGVCGRLKCCLRYEKDLYDSLSQKFPEIGKSVRTPHGKGVVCQRCILKGTVIVKPEQEGEAETEVSLDQLK